VTLSVRPYEGSDQPIWDELVGRSRSAHFLFYRGYMDYHADRFVDYSLLVLDEDRLVAALPANREGTAVVSHGGLTFGGLITDESMTSGRMLDAFAAVCDHLRGAGAATWLYKPVPHIYHRVPGEEDLFALSRHGARLIRRDVSSAIRLDVRLPYSKGRRAALKSAERTGIEVRRDDDFEAFMALQRDVLQARYGVEPVHTGAELALLAGRFPDSIGLHTARIDGRLVAGVVVYETPMVAHAQYIAANEEGREAHALDLILHTLIASYEGRKTWWDFGTSMEDDGRSINSSLARNKESYGARTVVYDRYALDL
jgi:Acetyltransferase (GNAT) domain